MEDLKKRVEALERSNRSLEKAVRKLAARLAENGLVTTRGHREVDLLLKGCSEKKTKARLRFTSEY